jgi:hypothetical protein
MLVFETPVTISTGLRPICVDKFDEPHGEAQLSAHNKPRGDAARIRLSWVMIVLIFLLIGLTGAYIISRR